MITRVSSENSSVSDRSVYNTRALDLSIARSKFKNATSVFANQSLFDSFISYIYEISLQNKLNLWISAEYGYDSVTQRGVVDIPFLQLPFELSVDRLYLYSKYLEYSGQYLQCPSNLEASKLVITPDVFKYIKFMDIESLYYNPLLDKSLPLNNSNKHIFIVMSPYNASYEFSTKENDWIFSYGLEWVTSLQPSSEGLCFTLEGDTASGKKLSYSTGGNNNLLTSSNSGINTLGVFSIKYDTINKNISTKFNGLSDTVTGLNYDVTLHNSNDIKSGNGFFLNSHIISNSILETTEAYNRLKNWKFYEMIIFEETLTTQEELLMNTYLKTKYGIL